MSTKHTLFMQSTEVSAERSAAEVSALLIRSGASQIATEYENQRISGLKWAMIAYGSSRLFEMPARVEPIYQLLRRQRKTSVDDEADRSLREQAYRVAWRQLLRWVQAQLAMIECGMVSAEEIFLPYIQTPAGLSLHETFKGGGLPALPAPETKFQ